MDLSVKKEVEDCLGSQLGVNTKLEKVLVILANHGYCFDTIIRPREMMVHPMNRGGSMVNGHDCHLKGGNILLTGLKPSLLAPSSLCMEVHRDPEKRKEQFLRNQNMITQAEGLLGDLHGDEKFLSLGNSHWIMFCRAMEQGAMNIEGSKLPLAAEMKDLVAHGWKWTVLKSEVADAFPAFPTWAASTLNSSNAIAKTTSELEAMIEIASCLKNGMTLEHSVMSVKQGLPTCSAYLNEVGHFVKLYAGGSEFPVLQLLKDFCCKYGPSILVGEEMMGHLSHYDFKVVNNPLPFCRAALLCTMLTSKKHLDGLQRLLVKSDLDRMKGVLKNKAVEVESLLKDGWVACQGESLKHADKVASFGKLCVRLILHLLGKEKHSRDKAFESFEMIVQEFTYDLSGRNIPREVLADDVHASSGSHPRDAEVKDLHQATAQDMALLQHPHLRLGDLYIHRDHGDQLFRLEKAEKDHCLFKHQPLFKEPLEVTTDWANVKQWKPSKKALPTLCPAAILEAKIVHASAQFKAEMQKAELTSILLKACLDNSKGLVKSLAFVQNPQGLYTTCKFKKGELVLYPCGHLSLVKASDVLKVKGCVVQFQGGHYLVSPFKTVAQFDIDTDGVLTPYASVQTSDDSTSCNMGVTHVTVKGAKIPVLHNLVAVDRHTLLLKARESKDKGKIDCEKVNAKRRKI